MKIKRSSWHYQLLDTFASHPEYSRNLCQYCRKVMIDLTIAAMMFLCVIGLVFCITILIIEFFRHPYMYSNLIIVVFFILSALLPVVAIKKLRKIRGKPIETPYKNVFTEYLKAKKKQICPKIDFI